MLNELFFFLVIDDSKLESSLDIFNFPSIKNLYKNNLEYLITIAPIALIVLSDKNSILFLNSSFFDKRSAHSSFDLEIDQKVNKLIKYLVIKLLVLN